MEQTVEKYIEGISSDTISSISTSAVGDSAMLAQMVSAIKQKLFSVATELVSSALKGGDRCSITIIHHRHRLESPHAPPQPSQSRALQAGQYSRARFPPFSTGSGARSSRLANDADGGVACEACRSVDYVPLQGSFHCAIRVFPRFSFDFHSSQAAPASSALQAKTKKRKPDQTAPPAAASPPTTAASAACSSSAPAVKSQPPTAEAMGPSAATQRALNAAGGVGGNSALGSSSSSAAADASSCPPNAAPLNGGLSASCAPGIHQPRQAGNLVHEPCGAEVDRDQIVKCEPET
jgi:hypothetical protein